MVAVADWFRDITGLDGSGFPVRAWLARLLFARFSSLRFHCSFDFHFQITGVLDLHQRLQGFKILAC
ncbi:hypothetical protein P8452_61594 [Trifolium repens]|nr:hypothetical protein P8452_61594 [Trifolium repens]